MMFFMQDIADACSIQQLWRKRRKLMIHEEDSTGELIGIKQYRHLALVPLLMTLIALAAACNSSDNNDKAASDPSLTDAAASLNDGQGVPDAPSYHGGSVPHKVYINGVSGLPVDWYANSIAEMQLYLKSSTTHTATGRKEKYSLVGVGGEEYELYHTTLSLTLMAAQTAEVIATGTIEGDNNFPDSVTTTIGGGNHIVYDAIDTTPVLEWLRPFVEQ
jgi:hypothetical protein